MINNRFSIQQPEAASEANVSVSNVSKKFCRNLKRSMAYGIVELSKNLIGVKPKTDILRKDEFWALDKISFQLGRGEILGVVGVNGSGKTTLLRLLGGIFPPDKGEIVVSGRVGALIAVGAGFHPHMTGHENIYLNGTILGMSRKEIDAKFSDIVDFADIGNFIDAPVSTYSSGMRVRLGFSIAVHLEPDIMLIDEILAVGDIGFRVKCFNAIERIKQKAAIVFISHQMPQIARICTSILVLHKGSAVYYGRNVPEGIAYYQSQFEEEQTRISGNGKATVHHVGVVTDNERKQDENSIQIEYLDNVTIEIWFSLDASVGGAVVNIAFFDKEMRGGAECYSSNCNFNIPNTGDVIKIMVQLPKIPLNPGKYSLTVIISDENRGETLQRLHAIREIQVGGNFIGFSSVQLQGKWSYM